MGRLNNTIIGYHNNYYERKLMRGVATKSDTSISHLITLDRSCDKMALINYTKYNKKKNRNKYKNN